MAPNYTNYWIGEPNNAFGGTEDGLMTLPEITFNYMWNDIPRGFTASDGWTNGYVVEFEPVPEPAAAFLTFGGLVLIAAVGRNCRHKSAR